MIIRGGIPINQYNTWRTLDEHGLWPQYELESYESNPVIIIQLWIYETETWSTQLTLVINQLRYDHDSDMGYPQLYMWVVSENWIGHPQDLGWLIPKTIIISIGN